MKAFRDGQTEDSVISAQTIDSLSSDNRKAWRAIRKELEGVGITISAFKLNHDLILDWFKRAFEAGEFDEQAALRGEDQPSLRPAPSTSGMRSPSLPDKEPTKENAYFLHPREAPKPPTSINWAVLYEKGAGCPSSPHASVRNLRAIPMEEFPIIWALTYEPLPVIISKVQKILFAFDVTLPLDPTYISNLIPKEIDGGFRCTLDFYRSHDVLSLNVLTFDIVIRKLPVEKQHGIIFKSMHRKSFPFGQVVRHILSRLAPIVQAQGQNPGLSERHDNGGNS